MCGKWLIAPVAPATVLLPLVADCSSSGRDTPSFTMPRDVLTAIACGAVALVEENRKRRAEKKKIGQDNKINLEVTEK